MDPRILHPAALLRNISHTPRRRLRWFHPRLEQLEDRCLMDAAAGIHTIQHVVIIMQENRSFDSYFGTYPGANGIPMQNGVPTVSVYDPVTKQYQMPYYNPTDVNHGGPH